MITYLTIWSSLVPLQSVRFRQWTVAVLTVQAELKKHRIEQGHSAWPGDPFGLAWGGFYVFKGWKKKKNRSKEACAAAAFRGLPSPKPSLSGPWQRLESGERTGRLLTHGVCQEQFCFVTKLKWRVGDYCTVGSGVINGCYSTVQAATGCSSWPLSGTEASQCGLGGFLRPYQ